VGLDEVDSSAGDWPYFNIEITIGSLKEIEILRPFGQAAKVSSERCPGRNVEARPLYQWKLHFVGTGWRACRNIDWQYQVSVTPKQCVLKIKQAKIFELGAPVLFGDRAVLGDESIDVHNDISQNIQVLV